MWACGDWSSILNSATRSPCVLRIMGPARDIHFNLGNDSVQWETSESSHSDSTQSSCLVGLG